MGNEWLEARLGSNGVIPNNHSTYLRNFSDFAHSGLSVDIFVDIKFLLVMSYTWWRCWNDPKWRNMMKRGNHINDVARSPFDGTPCQGPLRSVSIMFQAMKSMTARSERSMLWYLMIFVILCPIVVLWFLILRDLIYHLVILYWIIFWWLETWNGIDSTLFNKKADFVHAWQFTRQPQWNLKDMLLSTTSFGHAESCSMPRNDVMHHIGDKEMVTFMLLIWEIPDHLGCIKLCKSQDYLSTGAGFLFIVTGGPAAILGVWQESLWCHHAGIPGRDHQRASINSNAGRKKDMEEKAAAIEGHCTFVRGNQVRCAFAKRKQ